MFSLQIPTEPILQNCVLLFQQKLHFFPSNTIGAILFRSSSRDGPEQWKGERKDKKVLQPPWAFASAFLRG
jgi:hypothetical protein